MCQQLQNEAIQVIRSDIRVQNIIQYARDISTSLQVSISHVLSERGRVPDWLLIDDVLGCNVFAIHTNLTYLKLPRIEHTRRVDLGILGRAFSVVLPR